jgi:hypothetical protein
MFAYLNATESAATRADANQASLLGLLARTQQFSPRNGGVLSNRKHQELTDTIWGSAASVTPIGQEGWGWSHFVK